MGVSALNGISAVTAEAETTSKYLESANNSTTGKFVKVEIQTNLSGLVEDTYVNACFNFQLVWA